MNALELRRRTLGKGVYKKTVEGNPAIATDSLARMYPGIEMQGWTEQDSTTGAQLLDLSNTADRADTTYVLTDTGLTVTGLFYVSTLVDVNPNTDMYISYEKSGDGVNIVSIYNSSGLTSDDRIATYATQGGTFNTGDNSQINVLFYSGQGTSSSSTYSNVMLNEGTGAKPYEPYTGGAPSPSPDYPQEIVSAGNWNEETQKWEYEIEMGGNDGSSQTVLLTSDRPLTKWGKLEKCNGQWGWVYKSGEIVLDGSEEWSLYAANVATEGISFVITFDDGIGGFQTSLCDKYRNIDLAWGKEYKGKHKIYTDHMSQENKNRYFRPPSAEVETVEQWKTWLSENPLTVWYETAEETFVPLTSAEQEAMNALHTYRPTTVLSNQQDCDMILTYKSRKGMS